MGALATLCVRHCRHPAVNLSVAIEYPKFAGEVRDSVNYAEDRTAHVRTEIGFDMVQVAKSRYASQQYHDFIGFQVSSPFWNASFRWFTAWT